MWWSKTRETITPGVVKVLGITLLLDLLSFSGTVYQYLGLVNLYNLIDDPTLYVKVASVAATLTGLPTSLLNDKLYKIPPRNLMPVLYFTKGTSLFLYGLIMYQATWDPYLKLGLSFLVTIPLHFAAHFDGSYFERHLFVELSRRYGVTLGVTNSGRSIIGSFTHGIQVIIVGIIYNALPLEQCSLYLCSFCYILALIMSIVSRKLFKEYSGIPARKQKSKASFTGNLKTQFGSLLNCKIFKILLAKLLDSMTISHTYVALFFLSSGLDELSMSYISGASQLLHIACAVINILKYRFRWSTRFADMFIVGHVIALVLVLYETASWTYEVLVPWVWGGEVAEHSTMPAWMIGYYVISLSVGVVTGTISLIKQEFLQDNIPAQDRGSIAGVDKFISLSIHLGISAINVWLPDTYLYLFNFALSVVIHVMTLFIMLSFKFQEDKMDCEISNENIPLTSNHFSLEDEYEH